MRANGSTIARFTGRRYSIAIKRSAAIRPRPSCIAASPLDFSLSRVWIGSLFLIMRVASGRIEVPEIWLPEVAIAREIAGTWQATDVLRRQDCEVVSGNGAISRFFGLHLWR